MEHVKVIVAGALLIVAVGVMAIGMWFIVSGLIDLWRQRPK